MSETEWRAVAHGVLWLCWGTFGLVWTLSAAYNRWKGPRARLRSRWSVGWLLLGVAGWLIFRQLRPHDVSLGGVASSWMELVGIVVLVVATAFTVWARFALGTMWSSAAVVKEGHRLRTEGPYALVRHPIYTGLLTMLLGTALLNGLGRWLLLPVVGLVLVEAKIRREEELM